MEQQKNSYQIRLGKTNFIVCVKQSETAVKPLEQALCELCKREVFKGISEQKSDNLDKISKSS